MQVLQETDFWPDNVLHHMTRDIYHNLLRNFLPELLQGVISRLGCTYGSSRRWSTTISSCSSRVLEHVFGTVDKTRLANSMASSLP